MSPSNQNVNVISYELKRICGEKPNGGHDSGKGDNEN